MAITASLAWVKTERRDLVALLTTMGVACLMCPATVNLIGHPHRMWLHALLAPCAALLVWLCAHRWGVGCDTFGIRPPVSLRWHLIGLLLGLIMPFCLLPLWQALGLPAFVPPVGILPLIYAGPIWEETAFRGILLSVLLKLLVGGRKGSRPLIWRKALALALSATAFAACHILGSPRGFISSSQGTLYFLDIAISGLLFGIVRMCSGSLLPGMVMHAVTNLEEWILIF
jgi:membrane protease YdiL (CAAX protease family)